MSSITITQCSLSENQAICIPSNEVCFLGFGQSYTLGVLHLFYRSLQACSQLSNLQSIIIGFPFLSNTKVDLKWKYRKFSLVVETFCYSFLHAACNCILTFCAMLSFIEHTYYQEFPFIHYFLNSSQKPLNLKIQHLSAVLVNTHTSCSRKYYW